MYFAWLGFYTVWLIPAAIVGLLTFIFGALTMGTDLNFPGKEICDANGVGNITMCPRCDVHCPFWKLTESCRLSKITYLFDNMSTIVFTVFMSFWATGFLEMWKRKQAVIAWEWDLTNFEEEEQMRPEYEASVKTTRINPVTQTHEPYMPAWIKFKKLVFTNIFVIFMLTIVLMAVFAIMVYRVSIILVMYRLVEGSSLYSNTRIIISASAAFLNLLAIIVLNQIYYHVALWLTNLEQPRTQTEFEDSYTFKVFMFQCINYYSSLAYIAFFKGKFFNHPGDQSAREGLGKFKNDVCDPSGCLYELCIQLGIIMVGKQALNNFVEILLP